MLGGEGKEVEPQWVFFRTGGMSRWLSCGVSLCSQLHTRLPLARLAGSEEKEGEQENEENRA